MGLSQTQRRAVTCFLLLFFPQQLFAGVFSSAPASWQDWTLDYNKFKMNPFSLPKPFYLVRGTLPFFHIGGSALVNDDYIRLTPTEKSSAGWLWSQRFVYVESWEVALSVRIGGGGPLGADGLAFWYSLDPRKEGAAFGSIERWNGLGVFFDTFDNDGRGDHPIVRVLQNDGSWSYDPSTDGKNLALAECKIPYRNSETALRIAYRPGNLQILYQIVPQTEWSLCAQVPLTLPPRGYFGVSAATGGLTDNHDITAFTTYQLFKQESEENKEKTQIQTETDRDIEKVTNKLRDIETKLENAPQDQPPQQTQPPQQVQQPQQGQQPQQTQQPQQDQNNQQNYQQPPPQQNYQQQNYQQPPPQQNYQQQNYQQTPPQQNYQQPPPQQNYQQPPPQQNYQQNYQPPQQQGAVDQSLVNEVRALKAAQETLVGTLNNLGTQINTLISESRNNGNLLRTISQQQDQLNQQLQRAPEGGDSNVAVQVQNLQRTLNTRTFENAENVKRQVDTLVNTVNNIARKLDVSVNEQQKLSNQLRDTANQISESDSSSSWGFWYLLIMFQVVFGVAFMWWKKYKDERNKKLF